MSSVTTENPSDTAAEVLPGYTVDWDPSKHPRHRAGEEGETNVFHSAGVDERYFSTEEAAFFFERSNQWLYWGLRESIFVDDKGGPVNPMRVGGDEGRRRFTLTELGHIAESAYQRGNLKEGETHRALQRQLWAKRGAELPEIADMLPWPEDKMLKLIKPKEVRGIDDLTPLKRQMARKYPRVMEALEKKAAQA